MAKKKGMGRPPKAQGEGKTVRLDPGLAAKARAVAIDRGQTIGDYFLDISLATVNRDYAALLRKLEQEMLPKEN